MQTIKLNQWTALAGLALFTTLAHAQSWSTIANKPPGNVTNCMLLTDGGVMCQNGGAWYKLTPSSSGSYVNGTWSTLASLPAGYNPDAYASMALPTGKAVIVGGEYNNGNFALTNAGAVYDPVANTWTMLNPPTATTGSANHWACIGDAPATILANGNFLIGSKLYTDLAVLNPTSLTWTELTITGKNDSFQFGRRLDAAARWHCVHGGCFEGAGSGTFICQRNNGKLDQRGRYTARSAHTDNFKSATGAGVSGVCSAG